MTIRKYTEHRKVLDSVVEDWGLRELIEYSDRYSYGADGPENFCNFYRAYGSHRVDADVFYPNGSRSALSVDLSMNSVGDVSITDADRNDLLVELYNKIHDNPFDAVSAFSEIDETVSGIYGNVKAISGAITSLKRGDIRRAADYLGIETKGLAALPRTASKAWLQWNFAWKPTLSAIHDGAEKLASLIEKPRTYVDTFRVTCRKQDGSVQTYGSGENIFTRTKDYSESLKYSIQVATTIQSSGLPYKNKAYSAARVRWERTSMSWAIDYLLPVGSYLNAMEVAPFFSVTPVCSTYFTRLKGSSSLRGYTMRAKQWYLARDAVYISPVFPRMNSLDALLRPHRIANLAAVAILKLAHLK